MGVRNEEACFRKCPGRLVQASAIGNATFGDRVSGHRPLLRERVGSDDLNRVGAADPAAGIDNHHRPIGKRVVPRGDRDQLGTAGDRPAGDVVGGGVSSRVLQGFLSYPVDAQGAGLR